MGSEGHRKKAEELRLLPIAGSSLDFKSLHKIPDLPVHVPRYKLCEHKNINKCKAKSCPFAHSMEELSAWEEALAVERGTVENGEDWETDMNYNHIITSKVVSERVASKRMREDSLSSFGFERLEGDPGNEPFVDTRFISRITDSTYWTIMCLPTQINKARIGNIKKRKAKTKCL